MTALIAAAVVFLAIHFLVSGTRLRDVITGRIGEGPYMGLFALASVAALVWLGFAYAHAHGGPGDTVYWSATPATKWVQLAVTFVAFLLIVPGLLTPNPTSVRQEGVLDKGAPTTGILRVTRHPFLMGVALWAAGHILVNGDIASLVLFGTLLALGVVGAASIDAKRERKLGPAWDAFAAQTSVLPFGAILAKRQHLALSEIGWWRLAVGVVVWGALVFAHPILFGASPLPGR
jgi:uncharacterized membrane protein